MPDVVYNEIEPFACKWLRNLINAGHLSKGCLKETSIEDIKPRQVKDKTFHTFAGIGLWDLALRLAGWPEDIPVWTGSCPCQPFSVAGKRKGTKDERHLWPAWKKLIAECRPPVLAGEQVASPDGRNWLSIVRSDLEALGYVVGAADLCAAGVGAPHIRQRLYFVAYLPGDRRLRRLSQNHQEKVSRMGKSHQERREELRLLRQQNRESMLEATWTGQTNVMGNTNSAGLQKRSQQEKRFGAVRLKRFGSVPSNITAGAWSDVEWWLCRDGKARPSKPKIFPLAYGDPGRVGALKAYGNAIVPQVAATFIASFMNVLQER